MIERFFMENIVRRFQLQLYDGEGAEPPTIKGLVIGKDIKDMIIALVENYEDDFYSYEVQKIEFAEVKDEDHKAVIIEDIDDNETYYIK